jgi:hypothetical protein
VTSIVLLVLVGAWAGYLFLWWRDSRAAVPPGRNGIRAFSRQLGSLGGTASRPALPISRSVVRPADLGRVPRTTNDAARRRREVLTVLSGLAIVSLAAVPFFDSAAMTVHVLFDLVLLAYGLIRRRHISAVHEINVRMLYPDLPAVDDSVVVPMRRTVNG